MKTGRMTERMLRITQTNSAMAKEIKSKKAEGSAEFPVFLIQKFSKGGVTKWIYLASNRIGYEIHGKSSHGTIDLHTRVFTGRTAVDFWLRSLQHGIAKPSDVSEFSEALVRIGNECVPVNGIIELLKKRRRGVGS